MIFCFGRSHFVQGPSTPQFHCPSPLPLLLQFQTLAWITSRLCIKSDFPMHYLPMMSFNFSLLSACGTAASAAHLCLDLVGMSAPLIFHRPNLCKSAQPFTLPLWTQPLSRSDVKLYWHETWWNSEPAARCFFTRQVLLLMSWELHKLSEVT